MRRGQLYSAAQVRQDRAALEEWLKNRGHPFARVFVRTEPVADRELVNVTFVPKKGPLARITQFRVVGASATGTLLVERAFRPAVDRRYDHSLVVAARKRLERTGAFESVEVTVGKPDPQTGQCELRVRVEERGASVRDAKKKRKKRPRGTGEDPR
jgi:outer membrane protein assembly factor BamA